ncbi:O-antigen ligase family protein [Candidatus Gracilibacteria bacterium]|nr:O-antigen ligase family protein [Candidatus Gracilibacteria bacterium]
MRIFFWLCLLLLIPGLLLRIPSEGAGILATDILVPLYAVIWILKKLFIDRSFPKSSFVVPGIMFGIFAILSFFMGAHNLLLKEQILSAAYIVRFASLIVFGWAAADMYLDSFEQTPRKFFTRIFGISFVVLILGILQFYLIPDISRWSTEGGWDPHTGRLLGTWMDPNFIAGFIGFLLPMGIAHWYQTHARNKKFWILLFLALSVGALFLTFSRSGYLAAVAGLFVFFLLRNPKVIFIGIALATLGILSNDRAQKRVGELVGTISAIVLRDTDEIDPTASLRIQNWRKSITLWKKYPVFGIGYNTYRYRAAEEGIVDETYFSAGGSDSTHLTVLVTTGILGMLAYLWFWGDLLIRNWQRFRRTRNEYFLGFFAGITALFVHACFVNSLLFPLIFLPLIAIAGILDVFSSQQSGKKLFSFL